MFKDDTACLLHYTHGEKKQVSTEEALRWTVTVSKETDRSLRSFLSSQGILESERSQFIEQVVLAEVDAAVREVRQDRARACYDVGLSSLNILASIRQAKER